MKGHFSWRRQIIKEYTTKQGTILAMGVCGKEQLRQENGRLIMRPRQSPGERRIKVRGQNESEWRVG